MVIRRHLLIAAAALAASPALAARRRVVTILGDSITAGLGLPAAQAFPARLQTELVRAAGPVLVRPAGVSGDTTAGGLARVDFSVQGDTDVCLVALGGNDLLQGLDPAATRRNLDRIVARLQARKITVVLAGLTPPRAIGPSYSRDFAALFQTVARSHRVPLYPNLLAGVGPAQKQRDGLHPNAQGAAIIARGLAPLVAKALSARR